MWAAACPSSNRRSYPTVKYESKIIGCKPGQDVTLASLVGRKVSKGVIFGDLGPSWQITRDRPVSALLASRLPRTLELMLLAYGVSILLGVPLGVYAAVRQYSKFDYIVTIAGVFWHLHADFLFWFVDDPGLQHCI